MLCIYVRKSKFRIIACSPTTKQARSEVLIIQQQQQTKATMANRRMEAKEFVSTKMGNLPRALPMAVSKVAASGATAQRADELAALKAQSNASDSNIDALAELVGNFARTSASNNAAIASNLNALSARVRRSASAWKEEAQKDGA